MQSRSIRLLALASLLGASRLVAQATPTAILARAIVAAGGAKNLAAARGFEWEGRATVHVPGRTIALTGRWQILPPDSAVVTTWETSRGPASARSIVLSGRTGWVQRDTLRTPMSNDMLAEERHQFYLYSLMRLLPLRDPEQRLAAVGMNAEGEFGFRSRREDRLPVTLYFTREGRLARLITTFATNTGREGDPQEITLSGTMEAGGVKWFRKMEIRRGGELYFDLEITALRTRD